jgi:hypothetical protein
MLREWTGCYFNARGGGDCGVDDEPRRAFWWRNHDRDGQMRAFWRRQMNGDGGRLSLSL